MGDVLRALNERHISVGQLSLSPAHLAELLGLIDEGTISGTLARTVFDRMLESGEAPRTIVEAEGLVQITDTGSLEAAARAIIEHSPDEVARYKGGRTKLLGWFVGQLMRETRGKADPRLANEVFRKALDEVEAPS
jgi:aspartyl-tRNA(Asn)/glutamyl-tRNA(Gln) amidotransferase subunit B